MENQLHTTLLSSHPVSPKNDTEANEMNILINQYHVYNHVRVHLLTRMDARTNHMNHPQNGIAHPSMPRRPSARPD
jgi:hypothetical protein